MKTAGGHALIYAAAVMMQRAISFVMLPVYTRFLTPADYGVSQLLDMTVDVAGILLIAGTVTGLQRLYFAAQDESERNAAVSTTLIGLLGQGVVGTLLLCVLAPQIWDLGLSPAGSVGMVRIAAVNFSLSLLPMVPLLLLQIERRPVPYAAAMLFKLVLQLSFNILFVVRMHLGVWGILLSTTIANTVVGIVLAAWCLRRTGLRFDIPVLRAIGRFGAPYRLAGIATFMLTFGDRFFLKAYQGVASVGLYALSYQFGFLLSQIAHVPVMNAWEPQRYVRAREGAEAMREDTMRGFLLYNAVVLTAAVALACGARPVMRVLVGPEFRSAAQVVPIIVAAYVFNGWFAVAKFAVDLHGRTRPVAIASWVSVVVTCAAYWALIPPYGPAGAAWATLIGFAVRFAVIYFYAERAQPIEHGWKRVAAASVLAFAMMALPSLHSVDSLFADAALASAEVLLFMGCIWMAFLHADDRRALRSLLVNLMGRQRDAVRTSS